MSIIIAQKGHARERKQTTPRDHGEWARTKLFHLYQRFFSPSPSAERSGNSQTVWLAWTHGEAWINCDHISMYIYTNKSSASLVLIRDINIPAIKIFRGWYQLPHPLIRCQACKRLDGNVFFFFILFYIFTPRVKDVQPFCISGCTRQRVDFWVKI